MRVSEHEPSTRPQRARRPLSLPETGSSTASRCSVNESTAGAVLVRPLRAQSKGGRLRAPVAPLRRVLRSLFRLDVDIHVCPRCCPVSSLRRCARTPAATNRSATTQWPLGSRQVESHARARPTDRPTDRPPARPPARPLDRTNDRPTGPPSPAIKLHIPVLDQP